MDNPIERIVQWNKDAGLLKKGYSDLLESSFQIEEALEGLDNLPRLAEVLDRNDTLKTKSSSPKDISRHVVILGSKHGTSISDVDRLDKACDAIVFAVGSIAKLGLTAEQAQEALNIVMDANMAKLGCEKDEHGKLMKPDNFPNPEPRLQELLDKRN